MPQTNTNNSSDDIIVKGPDGNFRVLSQGEWQPLEAYRPQVPKAKPADSVQPKTDLGDLAKEIREKANLNLAGELNTRFQNIVKAHLKEVRNSLDTFLVLKRGKEEGGLGLAEEQAEQVLEIMNQKKSSLGPTIEESTSSAKADTAGEGKAEKKSVPLDLSHELAPPPPVIPQAQAATEPSDKPMESHDPVFKRDRQAPSPMKEMKFKPQLVGPVEEIKNLTLSDFRKFDDDPKAAVKKVIYKIDLLEKDSYQKRQEGIKAWRESEVNRLYLELGKLAMEQGRSISEIIKAKQSKNEPSLTMEEFEALLDLNSELKY